MSRPKFVLFLCSGNYYRSRFAECVFNDRAQKLGLAWRATSRGLAREFGPWNVGYISPFAEKALLARGIQPDKTRQAMHCCDDDLAIADVIVALKESEHRPLMEAHFPQWTERVEFWHIHDVDKATPEEALPEIERLVEQLIERLKPLAPSPAGTPEGEGGGEGGKCA
jgi:protein-tyrosine phosphatase